jgi:hypothetical protein
LRLTPGVLAAALIVAIAACGDNDAPATLAEASPFAAEVAELAASGDTNGLVALAELQTVACVTNVEGAGGPPQCQAGDADGIEYEVFPAAVCQGFWTRDVAGVLDNFAAAGPPFALAELGAPPAWAVEIDYPYGEQVLIFSPASAGDLIGAMALYLADERIVRAQIGCKRADQFLEPGVDEEAPAVVWPAEP